MDVADRELQGPQAGLHVLERGHHRGVERRLRRPHPPDRTRHQPVAPALVPPQAGCEVGGPLNINSAASALTVLSAVHFNREPMFVAREVDAIALAVSPRFPA